ncbi:hypothetical protein BT96DRAFT_1009656 [Gymnopus androsaceus JB14]|uniref:Uncharacterized protein n=1 Tax=Gymnopus androsaceus JB14 TaxID=1447944 RepID=A0A6A4GCG2_9AGAR|nr:hypothetical protein BT96DRAFT_1009656 [Gymnopus androsaceus JB14]
MNPNTAAGPQTKRIGSSSLRSDLIAEYVDSKNISQVFIFLTALEEASSNDPESSRSSSLDMAMEVSDDCLKAEEESPPYKCAIKQTLFFANKGEDTQSNDPQSLAPALIPHIGAHTSTLGPSCEQAWFEVLKNARGALTPFDSLQLLGSMCDKGLDYSDWISPCRDAQRSRAGCMNRPRKWQPKHGTEEW